MTVGVKIQSFLTDGRGCQHEWPERGVEGLPEPAPRGRPLGRRRTPGHRSAWRSGCACGDARSCTLSSARRNSSTRGAAVRSDNAADTASASLFQAFFVVGCEKPLKIAKRVNVLVQHRLQVASCTVVHDLSPVWSLVISGSLAPDERRRLREVEQLTEAPCDSCGGIPGCECRLASPEPEARVSALSALVAGPATDRVARASARSVRGSPQAPRAAHQCVNPSVDELLRFS